MPVSMRIRRIAVFRRSAKVAPWQVFSSPASSASSKDCSAFLATCGLSMRSIGLGPVRSSLRASQPKYTAEVAEVHGG
jgi:hypothetical protein